ncbi:MAG: aryl-alcohol dehydrogenase-like predicted oxidoreductase [Verrucomicrobiales bacterium]|jgi:aryl-alcohol dehydrogenase-like predicted oxidoreductase
MSATMEFGRTGHYSSRIIFGGAALLEKAWGQEWAETLLDAVVASGINHLDTAASYGDSELMIGSWLAASTNGVSNRSRVFLASKTGERSGDAARAELERSLVRLGVDQLDLIQLHNLVEESEWYAAHAAGGVLEAMSAARDEGLVRFIGVTGHGARIARMHIRSLDAFHYDSVLLPFNTTMLDNPGYRHDVDELLNICSDRGVAVQTIKSIARRRWRSSGHDVDEQRSWYQPLRDAGAIERAMGVVLANEQLFLNTSSDARLMTEMLVAARSIFQGADSTGAIAAPDEQAVRADIDAFDMEPLFDGADLERI